MTPTRNITAKAPIWALICCFALLAGCVAAWAQEAGSAAKGLDEIKALRTKAAHRARRIIFDNDGNEPVYYLEEASAGELIECRTRAVVGTQVDTVVYCTWSSGFTYFTHNTQVGEIFDCTAEEPGKGPGSGFSKNKTRAFIDQGQDALAIMADYCRANGIEFFWSMRMNDIHDAWGAWYSPFLFPPIKKEHPEWLLGSTDKKPVNGAWTAMDYGVPEVRDLAFHFFEEVCNNYDVDGVQMDFFRHLNYFRNPSMGKPATQEELDMMTSLLQRVRSMTDEAGAKRGRPILISVRVPDSADFCKTMGLDIERWMKEGLIDLLVVSGYFRLNGWEESVALGHKYGVPVYPCLSETRIRDNESRQPRASLEGYRARATNVWNAKADGIYMFNFFHPEAPHWSELGSLETLGGKDKVYTTAARGSGNLTFWYKAGPTFQNRSFVTPESSRKLTPGEPESAELIIGESLTSEPAPGLQLRVRVADVPDAGAVNVSVNGRVLEGGELNGEWLDFSPQPSLFKHGSNQVEVTLAKEAKAGPVWKDLLLWVRYAK